MELRKWPQNGVERFGEMDNTKEEEMNSSIVLNTGGFYLLFVCLFIYYSINGYDYVVDREICKREW